MSIALLSKRRSYARKSQMDMDAPIYLLFKDKRSNRCVGYVIEEKTTTFTAAPAVEEELRDDLLWRSSEDDTVRHLCLPDLDYSVVDLDGNDVSMVVSNSRIFFIGGMTRNRRCEGKYNGIIYVDLLDKKKKLSWKRCDRWAKDFLRTSGAVYNKQDDKIYVFGGSDRELVLRFGCRDVEGGQVLRVPDFGDSHLVASTDDEMLMYKNANHMHVRVREFKFFEMTSSSSSLSRSSGSFPCLDHPPYHYSHRNVLVEEGEKSFVVCFSDYSPDSDYCPGLYVYDIQKGKWLPKPVQELSDDGISLPSSDRPYVGGSLMRVNVDKLALVWAMETQGETQVHWSKFKLKVVSQVEDDETICCCFYREILSYGTCSGGSSTFIICGADVGANNEKLHGLP